MPAALLDDLKRDREALEKELEMVRALAVVGWAPGGARGQHTAARARLAPSA